MVNTLRRLLDLEGEVLLSQEGMREKISKLKLLVSKNIFDICLALLSCAFSVVLLIMFFSAAESIKTGGLEIMSIQSVGGKTLEEAYYHNLGYIYEGYCLATKAIGVFCASLLLLFGVSRVKNVK